MARFNAVRYDAAPAVGTSSASSSDDATRLAQLQGFAVTAGGTRRLAALQGFAAIAGGGRRLAQLQGFVVTGSAARRLATFQGWAAVQTIPAPGIVYPTTDQVFGSRLAFQWTAVSGPTAGPVLYTARFRAVGDPTWTVVVDAEQDVLSYTDVAFAGPSGHYEFEVWAAQDGQQSAVSAQTFIVNLTPPDAIVLTSPLDGATYLNNVGATVPITWEVPTDPDGEPLTVKARYRLLPDGAWSQIFSQPSSDPPSFTWATGGIPSGDAEFEIWAEDALSAGLTTRITISFGTVSRPDKPRVRIINITTSSAMLDSWRYTHPFNVPQKGARFQLIPFGGSFNNPALDVTVEVPVSDPLQLLRYMFAGLASGLRFQARLAYEDENGVWSLWSTTLAFQTLGGVDEWRPRWARSSAFGGPTATGSLQVGDPDTGEEIRNASSDNWLAGQDSAALVNTRYRKAGSAIVGVVGSVGCNRRGAMWETYYGAELAAAGVVLANGVGAGADGFDLTACTGFAGGMRSGLVIPFDIGDILEGATSYEVFLMVRRGDGTFENPVLATLPASHVANNGGRSEPAQFHYTMKVVRNLTTRQATVDLTVVGVSRDVAGAFVHVTHTFEDALLCGYPGVYRDQLGTEPGFDDNGWSRYQTGVTFTPVPDEGVPEPGVVSPPPTPVPAEADPPCVAVAEDAPAAPVLVDAAPEWTAGVHEEVTYLADVLLAEDDTEQRVQLRKHPRTVLRFTTLLVSARECGLLDGQLWQRHAARLGVPLWPDAVPLLQDVAAGVTSIPANFAEIGTRRFGEVAYVALTEGVGVSELLGATLELDGSLTLLQPTTRAWSARKALLVPVRLGRLTAQLTGSRESPVAQQVTLEFTLEAVS